MRRHFSIIVIYWNSVQYIVKTLPKLLSLDGDIEYVLVDNGSVDGTLEYIKQCVKGNPRKNIKIIENKENKGISVAKNQGVKVSIGDYILLLDDDMYIENTNFLNNISSFYQTLDNPAFLMPLFLDKEELKDGYTASIGTYYYLFGIKKKIKKRNIKKVMKHSGPIEIAINQGGAMYIKKDIWDDLGGFDESQKFNLDDDDISTRALVYGYKNYLYNKEYIVHMGFSKRQDKYRYAWNDLTYYSGKAKAIVKNFSFFTNLYMLPLFTLRAIAESIYHSFTLKYIKIFFATLVSIWRLFKDFPDTIKKRKKIQLHRKRSDKYILKLKIPDYESKG
ncbi:MAG: glycosyltransferase [Candidatus Dojkabacteria bacterium]|nr:glycosyltransferase [Candidatus Dojkabacteria bacterium]